MNDLSEKIVEVSAREDAAFDGRPWESMSRADRERYLARARRTQRIVLPIVGEDLVSVAVKRDVMASIAVAARLSEIMDGLK